MSCFFEYAATELDRARRLHAPIHSAHEGYAVLLEEMDELKGQVWMQQYQHTPYDMLEELIQIAAMCARIAEDLGLIEEAP